MAYSTDEAWRGHFRSCVKMTCVSPKNWLSRIYLSGSTNSLSGIDVRTGAFEIATSPFGSRSLPYSARDKKIIRTFGTADDDLRGSNFRRRRLRLLPSMRHRR